MSQHHLAALVGQGQSEVSEILKGRQVLNVLVLERIADGLGIPRALMILAGARELGAYPGGVTVANPVQGDEMLRRHFD